MSKELTKVRNFAKSVWEKNNPLMEREDTLAKGYLNIENEDFFNVDGVEFNKSLCFDDISEEKGMISVMNLFFIDIEIIGSKDISFVKRNFPSFTKIQKAITKLKFDYEDKVEDYITIGKGGVFETVEDFIAYAKLYEPMFDLYNDFLTEVDKYSNNQKFFELSNSGVVNGYSNGKRQQDILFRNEKNLYKISINSESYENQSYARLSIKDESGWTVLLSKNPKRDFQIDISYKETYSQNAFSRIINEFYTMAERLESTTRFED